MARKNKAHEKEQESTTTSEDKTEEQEVEESESPKESENEKKEETEKSDEEETEENKEVEKSVESKSSRDPSTVVSAPQKFETPKGAQTSTIEKPPSSSIHHTINTLVDSTLKFFVGGLHPNTDEAELSAYFSKYGQILSTQVMRDLVTGRHRGFGFVTIKVQPNSMNVFKDNHTVTGKRIDVRAMQTDVAASLRKKIFVGGLSKALNEEMLHEYFSKFGEVDKVTIMRQLDGSSRGFGFIMFTTDHGAEGALKNPTHFVYGNKVDVRAAETRPKQSNQQQSNQAYQYGMVQAPSADMYSAYAMNRPQATYDPNQYANMTQQQMLHQQYPQYQLLQQQMVQQQMAMAGTYGGYYAASGQQTSTPGASTAAAPNPYAQASAYGPYRGKNEHGYPTGATGANDPSMNPRGYRQHPY